MKILLVRQDHPNRIRSCRDKARRGGVTPYSSRGGSPGTGRPPPKAAGTPCAVNFARKP
jgi:hypothetical protein